MPTWVTCAPAPSISRDMRRSYQEAGTTLRPCARYRSLPFFVLPGWISPADKTSHPSEVLSAFNECHPGCPPGVYFYDASEIRLTREGEGGRMVLGERKRHEAAITIGEFLLLCLFLLSTGLTASRALPLSFFFFFHAKTPRLISPVRMTLRGQVVGDSKILPAGLLLVHGMYSAYSGSGIIRMTWADCL